MMRFAKRWAQRRWGVEGCHGAGRWLGQFLVGSGETVVDVPAKLAARVRVFSQGHGRKTDHVRIDPSRARTRLSPRGIRPLRNRSAWPLTAKFGLTIWPNLGD